MGAVLTLEDYQSDEQVQDILQRMPDEVARSFSLEQLRGLKSAIATRQWGQHPIDVRGSVPLIRHRYYFALVCGRNRREMTAEEKAVDNLFALIVFAAFLCFCMVSGLVTLYLIKSALGIDLFSDYSFGLWTCVQNHVL